MTNIYPMLRYMTLATLAVAALCAGCDLGEDEDRDEEEEYVDSGVYIAIPDDAFRTQLFKMGVDYNNDGRISTSEAARWKEINIIDCDDIRSLEGLEHFTGLTVLTVKGRIEYDPEADETYRYGQIKEVDLSHNGELRSLDLSGNRISELHLSDCPKLQSVNCDFNDLETIDLRGLEALVSFYCYRNPLHTLTLGSHPLLTQLVCFYCQLKAVDLSGCPALYNLVLMGPLATLDLSECKQLGMLELYLTQIEKLDLRAQHNLNTFICMGNEMLTEIEGIEGNTGLKNISIAVNQKLTGILNFDSMADLENVSIDDNGFTELIVRNCAALKEVYCMTNPFTRAEVSACPQLASLTVSSKVGLETMTLSGLPSLKQLLCIESQLIELDLSEMPALQVLGCSGNNLMNLDLSTQNQLVELMCSNNRIQSLDLSKCTALEVLDCGNNDLRTLDIRACAANFWIECRDNDLLATIRCRADQLLDGYFPEGTQIVHD